MQGAIRGMGGGFFVDLTETAAVVYQSIVALGSLAVPARFRFGPNEGMPLGDKNAPVLRRNGQHGGIVDTGQTGGRRGPEIDLRGSPNDRCNNDLIEIGVGLEPDGHSAHVRSLPLGVGQLLVEHRIGLTARLALGTKVTLPSIATVTYLFEGSVRYEDTTGAKGVLQAGGVEWFKAGHGAWHGGGPGDTGRSRGFQLWLALPPGHELGPVENVYLAPDAVARDGPARVLVGTFPATLAPSPMSARSADGRPLPGPGSMLSEVRTARY